jgi:AraC-like DNA-binding protein/mannose-6-phosphate isomerase-like protein (cupin superfamily)
MEAPTIGETTQLIGATRRAQRCSGTYRGDIPDPRFRFNVLFVEHDGPFPMHGHEYAELVVVLGGSGVHRTDRGTYPIQAGDVFVVNGSGRHGFPTARSLRLCNVQFDPRQFFRNPADLGRMMGFHALFDLEPRSGPPHLRLTASQLAFVEGQLRSIEEEFRGAREGRQTAVRGSFLLLVTHLARLYGAGAGPGPVSRMASVLAYARTHFRGPVRVETLARIAHLSPSQFRRVFRRTFRLSPARYLARLRIEEACELLKDSRAKLSAVAREAGFGSAAFFSTRFRRLTGLSPREYRRRLHDASRKDAHEMLG